MGELTLACSPSRGTDGLCVFGRSAGLPGRRASRPGVPDSAGPEDRLIGPDPRIISRVARGQSFVRLIERESSDAIAKGWVTVIRAVMLWPGLVKSMARGVGYPGRHVVSWAGQVDGAGSREDPLEFGGLRKVGSIDPNGPAWTSLPALESGWHCLSTRIPAA